MTILCSGNCHVFLGSSSLCTCEAHKTLSIPLGDRVALYGFPAQYNPFTPSRATPPTGGPTVSIDVFRAAQLAGATHLSADGLRIYRDDRGGAEIAFLDEGAGEWGSWWSLEAGLPADAVRM